MDKNCIPPLRSEKWRTLDGETHTLPTLPESEAMTSSHPYTDIGSAIRSLMFVYLKDS
jgi:hypothetical protein